MTHTKATGEAQPAWDGDSLRDPHAQHDKARRVESMFDAIAPTYERVNAVASLAQDAGWRRKAIAAADIRAADVVLDVCCGTGDMIRTIACSDPSPARIFGLDFAAQMLARGDYTGITTPIQLVRGDALNLPFADESLDVVTCAFGVRNFQDLSRGLREMRRVLRPGGRVVILEFALPENALLRFGYRLYTGAILPRLGALLSRDKSGAYRYLPRSIQTFERRAALVSRLREAGLADVATRSLNLGGVVIYRGQRPKPTE